MVSQFQLSLILLISLTFYCGCGFDSVSSATASKSRANAQKPNCKLQISLPGTMVKGRQAKSKIEITNVGNKSVTLVAPGDGSRVRWRTPVIGWSIIPAGSSAKHPKTVPLYQGGRCGNINPLKRNEIFVLKPGKSIELNQWVWFPIHSVKPGEYDVVFYYKNVPGLKWSGLPLGKHDARAMRRVKASSALTLVSNEVQVKVIE